MLHKDGVHETNCSCLVGLGHFLNVKLFRSYFVTTSFSLSCCITFSLFTLGLFSLKPPPFHLSVSIMTLN